MLARKQYKTAENLFKLNLANNPSSGNDYDSIGDFYLAINNKLKAIEAFKKALTLQAIPETKEKLNKLLSEDQNKVKQHFNPIDEVGHSLILATFRCSDTPARS